MKYDQRKALGKAVQDYVRLLHDGDEGAAMHRLEPTLQERIEVLGLDADRLLEVPPEEVVPALEALEREAEREDARVRKVAIRTRAKERRG